MAQPNASTVLARASALADSFASRALQAEQLGRLPDETVAELIELGIARVLVPRQWGGLELEFKDVIGPRRHELDDSRPELWRCRRGAGPNGSPPLVMCTVLTKP